MGFDFSFDPGTSEELRRQIDGVSARFANEERAVIRADDAVRRFEQRVRQTGRTMRSEFGGGGRSARAHVGNIKDVVDLTRGQIDFRNIAGAFELAGDLGLLGRAGPSIVASVVPVVGTAIAAAMMARGLYEDTKDAITKPIAAMVKTEQGIKKIFPNLGHETRMELQKDLRMSLSNQKIEGYLFTSGGGMGEHIIEGEKAIQQYLQDRMEVSKDGALGAALIAEFYAKRYGTKYMTPAQRRQADIPNVAQTQRAVFENQVLTRQRDKKLALALEGFLDREVDAFRQRAADNDDYFKNHPVERAAHRARMLLLGAVEKKELLATQDWNKW